MKGNKIKVGDNEIHYEKFGKGSKVVLFLHGGLGSSRTDFGKQLNEFDRYDFTVVAWDAPGFGFSRPPERNYTTDVFDIDARIANQFMKALGFEKYSVVGWSDGGKTAISMAYQFPETIEKLVTFGALMYSTVKTWLTLDRTKTLDACAVARRKELEAVYGKDVQALWIHYLESMRKCKVYEKQLLPKEKIKSIKCPVFILHGDLDPISRTEQMKYLHSLLPQAKIYRFAKGSHDLHIVYSDMFNDLVQDFLLE